MIVIVIDDLNAMAIFLGHVFSDKAKTIITTNCLNIPAIQNFECFHEANWSLRQSIPDEIKEDSAWNKTHMPPSPQLQIKTFLPGSIFFREERLSGQEDPGKAGTAIYGRRPS